MRMRRPRIKPTRYIDLPRSRRRDRFVSLRYKISQDRDGHGVFTTRHVLPGSAEWASMCEEDAGLGKLPNYHAEARFLSSVKAREGWLYHGDFRSIEMDVFDRLEQVVDARIDEILASAGLTSSDATSPLIFGPPEGFGSKRTYRMLDTPWPRLDAFEGQTLFGARADVWAKLTPEQWGTARASFRLDFSCPSGVDLYAVVPDTNITLDTVAARIRQFLEMGEAPAEFDPVSIDAMVPAVQAMIDRQIKSYRKIETVS
jgi:hypothetical protein